MHDLLERMILPAFANPLLAPRHDSAVCDLGGIRVAFTTDGYVVRPLVFPGGDIGALAVNGTVNDLAMAGARPRYLSAALIIEEGFAMQMLGRILASMRAAAETAGVLLITGDTKVVDRGKGDGIYIATAGLGTIEHGLTVAPHSVRPGDAILLSGDIGRHGMAVMAVREGLSFDSAIESDCASLHGPVQALLDAGIAVRCLRDCTRGGLASALIEIAEVARLELKIHERDIPVREDVQGACEILGFDPLYVANEGRFVCFVPAAEADRALALLRAHHVSAGACRIGEAVEGRPGRLLMQSRIGTWRIVDRLSGEQLPRIC
jgi:hydrogenase expression/formation protein HypE